MRTVLHRLVGVANRDGRDAVIRGDDGVGLIELLIAMLVLSLGIMAIVAGFSSGMVALNNASRTGTAGTLADKQMEAYRALAYAGIRLTSSPSPPTDSWYRADPAYDAVNAVPGDATCSSSTATCMPVQTKASGLSAPDGRSYRLDTYVVWNCPVSSTTLSYASPYSATSPGCTGGAVAARPVKKVTVVVRDGDNPTKTYISETSTFDAAT
jgi:type II secretory pathway pseudopilin PulG